jgi:ethanolamine ammonia-lyase small subunit
MPTAELLRFAMDHAEARDAVRAELDLDALQAALAGLGLPMIQVRTRANDRVAHLQRPDWGRSLDDASRASLNAARQQASTNWDIALVVADGLSAQAAQLHAPPLLARLIPELRALGHTVAPIVLAKYARVALQDDVGSALGARSSLILLGERPGLQAPVSLGAYLVFNPRVGNTDERRNCVSNIRPGGLDSAAATTLLYLITQSLRRQISGVSLKDERSGPRLEAGR